ncbi:ABC transporter substrate-binding protein [Anaeromyxobacter oryzisoli]|uniref:ABC transporter substrate-binding protein n=1 Tax=Anaeromyxobacter oryzisoli TaxID=2925408 RepID=UPI001F57BA49|nr:ABC transporter substrate-binding protein [Anaeromyxobacter sp. SG63]
MRRLLGTVLLCALFLPALAADVVKLAITGPFTGGSAPLGTSMRDGAKLAIAEINAAGGIAVGDRKLRIEVIERDDEARDDRGAAIARELAATPDLSGVIGSANTGVALAGDRFLQEKGITKIVTPAAGSAVMAQWARPDGPRQLSIFRFAASDGIQAAMVVEEAIARRLTKVALLHDSTRYGVSGRDDLLMQVKLQGEKLQVVAVAEFDVGDRDLTSQLLRARSGGAQAILLWGIGPEAAAVAKGMARLGMRVPLIGGWTLSMSSYLDDAGRTADGTLMPQTFIEEPVTPRARRFIEDYHRTYGVTRIPSPVSAAQGYDAVQLFAAAVRQAGSTESGRIRDALEDLRAPVSGVIATWRHPYSKWDPAVVDTHEAFRRKQVVMGMVQDGRVVFANQADKLRLVTGGL